MASHPQIDPLEPVLDSSSAAAAVPVLPAATVMLLRDGEPNRAGQTLEVCLLRRNLESTWVGGVYVFPGGAVDPEDADEAVLARCDGVSPAQARAAGGLGFWVASVRETFEEAGLLPAHRTTDGAHLRLDDPAVAARFHEHRRAVDAGTRTLGAVLEAEDLRLDLSATHYVSRWVTPLGLTRRYDTRFFLAAAPQGQKIDHDGRETIAAEWHRPRAALERHTTGEMVMRIPTVASLQMLTAWPTVGHALAAAAAIESVPTITGPPRVPGDAQPAAATSSPTVAGGRGSLASRSEQSA